ncbi:pre-peptidase C-terminal domain-containing protein [Bacillus sp. OV194]|nr:pre-peptidase C-terminal domain-containing protein [Bacillus sp. OV194]
MKKYSRFMAGVALGSILLSFFSTSASADDENWERRKKSFQPSSTIHLLSNHSNDHVKNRQAIVKTTLSNEELVKRFGVTIADSSSILGKENLTVVRIPEKLNYEGTLRKLKRSAHIESAEPDYMVKKMSNDPYYSYQWPLPKMKVPNAWLGLSPKARIKVAVIDSGVDYTHPDLEGRVLSGYDTYDEDSDPMDYDGHGTAVAGVIAATVNNGIGMAGINPYADILPVRVGDEEGMSTSDCVEGIYYAISQKADVINMSYGGSEYEDIEYDAIRSAYEKGIVLVAASGNEDDAVGYPAAYPEVLSVGASTPNDGIADFSNYGELLDIVAPGTDVLTAAIDGEYDYFDGTSFSAPIVSGLASLILAEEPSLYPDDVEYLLESSAYLPAKYKGKWNQYYGYGRADALKPFYTKLPSLKNDVGDRRSKAKKVTVGKQYSDKFDTPSDVDWFTFKVSKKTNVRVDVSGVAGINSTVWIDKYSNGRVINEKPHDARGLNGKESFTASLTAGTYYLTVYDNNYHWAKDPYSIKVTAVK